jgi:ATP phosphoribosyltransferase regulatory subunit
VDEERWLLPAGIEEVLPEQARMLEALRRELLDLYRRWGYELVIPPFLDYLESLLTGTGRDLDLQTLKLTDQLSGRLLGVRADMTPQVARMDAHELGRCSPARLCYLGTVLRALPEGAAGSRSPLQLGAEIFGHAGVESDVEILQLLIATLGVAGIEEAFLDLGHVGIFRGLACAAELSREQEISLFDALQRKAIPEIEALIDSWGLHDALGAMLRELPELCGDDALERAERVLVNAPPAVKVALAYLRRVADELNGWLPEVPVHFDLAELRGYQYKTGVVFAAFAPNSGQEIARGGRYDEIGKVFGRARPAVGFSADLRVLMRVGGGLEQRFPEVGAVLAPWSSDGTLQAMVQRLRAAGRRVIRALPGQEADAREWGCEERLVPKADGAWVVEPL